MEETTPGRKPNAPAGWQAKFIAAFAKNGNISASAKAAKVDRRTVQRLRESDEAFAADMDNAAEEAADLLEEEARRRATVGTLKTVWQGGKKMGSVRIYSDTLLIVLLKATRPDKFRDNAHIDHSGSVNIGITEVIVEMPPAGDADK